MSWSPERIREEQQKRINEPSRVAQVDKLAADLHIMGIDDREVAAFLNRMGWTKRDGFDQIVTKEDWKLRHEVMKADAEKAAEAVRQQQVDRIKEAWELEEAANAAT